MLWLLSLLMPSRFRRDNPQAMDEFAALIKSPQSRGLLGGILGIVAACCLAWVVMAAILSIFKFWMILGLVVVLGVVAFVRDMLARRRENWIQQGYCAQCGYDLRAEPVVCPKCGRDAKLDEPVWRRMRRELEAKLLANAAGEELVIRPEPVPPADIILPPPRPAVFTSRPVVDEGPIPLEGSD